MPPLTLVTIVNAQLTDCLLECYPMAVPLHVNTGPTFSSDARRSLACSDFLYQEVSIKRPPFKRISRGRLMLTPWYRALEDIPSSKQLDLLLHFLVGLADPCVEKNRYF